MRRCKIAGLALIALAGCLCCMGRTQAADIREDPAPERDYVLGRPMTEEEIREIEAAVAPFSGAGGYLEEDSALMYARESAPMAANLELPRSYDVRGEGIEIGIETQRYGDCWAFAALDLLQINGQKQGIMGGQNLSERHLVYYTYHSVCGTPGQQQGEGTSFLDNGQVTQCFWNGGKYDYAVRSLGSYLGAVPEDVAPYPDAAIPLSDSGEAYEAACIRLKGASAFPADDRDLLKRMILQYGAAGITYCSSISFYEYSTAAQYCPSDMRADHAVTVIGWDDDYRRENFKIRPEADGAWLVQNSWGTVFGDQGFFWLSYEDASIAENAYVLEAGSEFYDYIYQCDNTVLDHWETARGELRAANCYTLEGTWGCQETLRAVNVTVPAGGVSYRLDLYDLSGGKNLGEQALLPEPVTGQIAWPGNVTIELPEGLVMAYGSRVGVALTLYGEVAGIYTDTTRSSGRTFCRSEGGVGTSYLMKDGRWEDYGAATGRNFRIKLLTDQVEQGALSISEIYENYLRIEEEQQGIQYFYRQLLHRRGEARGLAYWQEYRQAQEPIMVLAGFLWSSEYRQEHPGEQTGPVLARCIEMQTGQPVGEICQLYQNILEREYDIPGLLYWLERRKEGLSIQEIEEFFFRSPEYLNKMSEGHFNT